MLRHATPRFAMNRQLRSSLATAVSGLAHNKDSTTTTSITTTTTPFLFTTGRYNSAATSTPTTSENNDENVAGAPTQNSDKNSGTVSHEAYNNGTGNVEDASKLAASSDPAANPKVDNNNTSQQQQQLQQLSLPERQYWLKTLLNAASTKFLTHGKDDVDDDAADAAEAAAEAAYIASGMSKKNASDAYAAAAAAAAALERKRFVSEMTTAPMHVKNPITGAQHGATGGPGGGTSRIEHQIRKELRTRQPATRVEDLLLYNKKWSRTIRKIDPTYFEELAKQQTPKFLWIGCADSRVPANQILGLAPGEVFVHRNVANIVSRSDLNCLSVVQFGVEHLRVEQLLVVGHYGCGGVTAAYKGLTLGLVDNWVSNVADIKYRNEERLQRVPEDQRIDCLCDLNAITQALNVAESNVVQAHWRQFRDEQDDKYWTGLIGGEEGKAEGGKEGDTQSGGEKATSAGAAAPPAASGGDGGAASSLPKQPLAIHGWCYGLVDGLVHPLVEFGPYDDVREKAELAIEAIIAKRIAAHAVAMQKKKRASIVDKKL